jgi:hypothetical protein
MPLKHPADVPKVPKTRKKNPEAAKTAIPQKKEDKIEYTCSAVFLADELRKKQYCAFRVRTVAVFTSFAYEISIDKRLNKHVIDLTILGLQTRINYLPKTETAMTDILFENLYGDYTVNVIKQDGSINSAVYNFNIFKKEIKLVKKFMPEKKNNRLFCDFDVSQDEFTFLPE